MNTKPVEFLTVLNGTWINPQLWFKIGEENTYVDSSFQAWIAQLVAHRLGTMEVKGSNPGKGESLYLT